MNLSSLSSISVPIKRKQPDESNEITEIGEKNETNEEQNSPMKRVRYPIVQNMQYSSTDTVLNLTIDKKHLNGTKKIVVNNVEIIEKRGTVDITVTYPRDLQFINSIIDYIRQYQIPLYFFKQDQTCQNMSVLGALVYYVEAFIIKGRVKCYILQEGKYPELSIILGNIKKRWSIESYSPIIESVVEIPQNVKLYRNNDINVDGSAEFDSIIIIDMARQSVIGSKDISELWDKIKKPKLLLSIGIITLMSSEPDYHIEDDRIFGIPNTIKIWNNGNFKIRSGYHKLK